VCGRQRNEEGGREVIYMGTGIQQGIERVDTVDWKPGKERKAHG
jgi:hypothetical protein